MAKAQKIILIIALLLIPIVYAEETLWNKIISTEKNIGDDICDNGEWFWYEDCKGKSFLEQIWFLKTLLILITVILFIKRKTIPWKTIIIIAVIMFILLNLNLSKFQTKPKEINNTEPKYSCVGNWCYAWHGNSTFKSNSTLMKAGEVIYGPSHPERGVAIIVIFLFIIGSIAMGLHDRIADWIYNMRRGK